MLITLGQVALFSKSKITTSWDKHLQDVIQAHIVSLMFKLMTIVKKFVDLSFEFDRDRNRGRDDLTHNKNIKSKYQPRIILKVVCDFVEHLETATYGLGSKLTWTWDKD